MNPRRSQILRELGIGLFFLILTVAMTWPLAPNLRTAVSDPGDPYLNTWILEWAYWATFHSPLQLFHAPIFHPARYAFVFSENLYGVALLFFPLYALGVAPLTIYNLAFLIGFAFCGYGAFVLARLVTGSTPAALAAGIFFAFVPFRFTHLSHLQHVWSGWLPLLLAAFLYYYRRPSGSRAAWFGVVFLMNGLSNLHWSIFGPFALLVSTIVLVASDRRTRTAKFWLPIVISTVVAVLALLLFLLPYLKMSDLYHVERNPGETLLGSAELRDWFITRAPNKTYGDFPITATGVDERWLFPGVLALLFTVSALLLCRRNDFPDRTESQGAVPETTVPSPSSQKPGTREVIQRRLQTAILILDGATLLAAFLSYYAFATRKQWPIHPLLCLVGLVVARLAVRFPGVWGGDRGRSLITVARNLMRRMRLDSARWRFPTGVQLAIVWLMVGFLCSFGMRTFFYRFLFESIRPLRAFSTPARWAMIAYVGMSVLIAAGILPQVRTRDARKRTVIHVAIVLAFLLELRAAPIRWYQTVPDVPPVYRWLSTAPISGAVVELPFGLGPGAAYLLGATRHHRPLVNGVSGYFPPHHDRLMQMAGAEPVDRALLSELEKIGCSTLIVHHDKFGTSKAVREWLRHEMDAGRLAFVRRIAHATGGDYVFALSREERNLSRLRPPEQRDASGFTPQQTGRRFVEGVDHAYNDGTFGWLDSPKHDSEARGELKVQGWALSPSGISAVNLLFDNGRDVFPAELFPWAGIANTYPWYGATTRPGFVKIFPARPWNVRSETDLQVEIVDGRGKRTRLEPVFIRWLTRGKLRIEAWDERALDALLLRLGLDPASKRAPVLQDAAAIRPLVYQWSDSWSAKSDAEFIDAMYRVLLNRGADPPGREFYVSKLAHGTSRHSVADIFLQSPEFARLHRKN